MARIDINTVLDGEYEVRVGNEYEIAPGVWGVMKPPTARLQEKVFEKAKEENVVDSDIAKMVLSGLSEFNNDDLIAGMATRVTLDFFTLLRKMGERLTRDSTLSDQ